MTFENWSWLACIIAILVSIPYLRPKHIWFNNSNMNTLLKVVNIVVLIAIVYCTVVIHMYFSSISDMSTKVSKERVLQLIDDGYIDEDSVDMEELNDSRFGILYDLKYNANKISLLECLRFFKGEDTTITCEITGQDSIKRITLEEPVLTSDDGSYYIVDGLKFLRDEYKRLDELANNSDTVYLYYDSNTGDSDIITTYILSNELMW